MTIEQLVDAVQQGDEARVRLILHSRPELISRDLSEGNEHRALHFAVLLRNASMVRLLMEAGADARKGIWPHRDATSAFAIARDREYTEISTVIEDEERRRREELSCPNATISPVQHQINKAIQQGDNEAAIRLLEADATLIQACDRDGASPLHVAAQSGNLPMAEWLLQRRAKVDHRDIHNHTPLDAAALAADETFPEMARLLLRAGAELTLFAAVALGDRQNIRELGGNQSLLSLAVRHGQIDMVRHLLDLGADVDERTLLKNVEEPTPSWGMPLWHAALENQQEIARLLLDRGADPNSNVYASGWPLRNAWDHPDGVIRQLLLERGARKQPYMVAETHDVDEAKRLLETDATEGLAQELAWSAADHGCAAIVDLALPRLPWPPSDPRWNWILIQPIRGATPENGHFECMAALLKHGIDPNVPRYGQTALHFAAAYSGAVSDEDRAQFAAMLIDHGASLTLRDDLLRSTPLGWACRWGRQKLAALLIERGAPVEEPDAEPWATPQAWAKKMATHIAALPPDPAAKP